MVVRAQLAVDLLEALGGVALGDVDHVHEQARSLEMREELVAEPGTLARALDQPGDVGDHELALVRLDRAEHRLDRRERVVGDLRLRVRDPAQERRLAGVRQAGQRGVGEELQVQLVLALLAGKAGLRESGRLPGRGGEAAVAAPAGAAAREHRPSARVGQVGDQLVVRVEDLRAGRDPQLGCLPRGAVLSRAAPVPAARGREPAARAEPREITQVRVDHRDDVAAGTAVTAVRAPLGHVLLAPEAERAVAAAPRLHLDAGAIREHGRYSLTMATRRRPPLVLNATRPSRLAKIVSSLPRPAPGPGRKRVPRWRTMIVPAVTPWPSKTLTPSILGFESRPFLDEPSPFL